MKLGRTRPELRAKVTLGHILNGSGVLPTAPDEVDYSSKAMESISRMYGNDRLGDCVIAGLCHVRGVTSGNAGSCVTFTDDQIEGMYSAIGGYVLGNPSTDNGCNELAALSYLTTQGFPDGVKLAGFASLDATNREQVKSSIWLFENVVFGMELPVSWLNPDSSGFVWGVSGDPVPRNGHCVVGVGHNESGVIVSTWGMLGTVTWDAVAKYASQTGGGELHVALVPDAIARATGRTPAGFDLSALEGDLTEFIG